MLRLDRYTDRFHISPSNGTRSTTAHIIVINSSLIDVDFGQQYYSFMVCLSSLLIQLYGLSVISLTTTALWSVCHLSYYYSFMVCLSSPLLQLYDLFVTSMSLILNK